MIRLDARLLDVVPPAAFTGELDNGHRIVAYICRDDRDRLSGLQPGQTVCVEMSPYDMSQGRIVGVSEKAKP